MEVLGILLIMAMFGSGLILILMFFDRHNHKGPFQS